MSIETPAPLASTPVEAVIDLGGGFVRIDRIDVEHRDDWATPDGADEA